MALPPGVRPVRAADGVIVVSRPRVLRPRPTERSNAVRAALSSAACHRSTLSRTLVRMTSFPHHFPHRPVALAAGARGTSGIRRRRWSLSAGALAVPATWPAAGPTLAFLQLLLGPANAAFSGHLLLGILDPTDELGSGQRRDVLPSSERRGVGDQRLSQVCGKLVHHTTGHSLAAHRATVAVQGPRFFHQLHGTDRRLRVRLRSTIKVPGPIRLILFWRPRRWGYLPGLLQCPGVPSVVVVTAASAATISGLAKSTSDHRLVHH